jgi:hypothetical protein
LELDLLVRLPSGEQLAEAGASGGDEPLVVVPALRREHDHLVGSALDEGSFFELPERRP